jgi:hypothetical protein
MSSHRSVEIVEKRLFFYLANNMTTCFLSRPQVHFPCLVIFPVFFLFRNEHRGKNTHTPARHGKGGRCCLCCAESPKGDSSSANKDTQPESQPLIFNLSSTHPLTHVGPYFRYIVYVRHGNENSSASVEVNSGWQNSSSI